MRTKKNRKRRRKAKNCEYVHAMERRARVDVGAGRYQVIILSPLCIFLALAPKKEIKFQQNE